MTNYFNPDQCLIDYTAQIIDYNYATNEYHAALELLTEQAADAGYVFREHKHAGGSITYSCDRMTVDERSRHVNAQRSLVLARRTKPPVVVCLCGSTRFSEAFHEANLRETLAGHIVLSIGIDTKSDADLLLAGEITPEDKQRLDELHLRKIDLADEVLILNVGGYIGESTARELAYARTQGKAIRFLEEGHEYV
jgi:hypothetical protein